MTLTIKRHDFTNLPITLRDLLCELDGNELALLQESTDGEKRVQIDMQIGVIIRQKILTPGIQRGYGNGEVESVRFYNLIRPGYRQFISLNHGTSE
jgi:hypothetical protein